MKTVADVLRGKGHEVITADPETTLQRALQLMQEHNIGSLLLTDDAGEIAGIFSERDFARFCAEKHEVSLDSPVSEMMTARVVCVSPEQKIEECMSLMTSMRLRHLPVLEDGTLVGLVSIGDAVKALQSEKDYLIDQLEHYIAGSI